MPLTILYYRFIEFLTVSAGIFELYFDWFFCCSNEKGKIVARSAKKKKKDILIFSLLPIFSIIVVECF